MGGYRVMPEAEKLIVSIWQKLRTEGKEHSASKVLTAAQSYITATNKKNLFLPGLRKTQDILKDARKQESETSPVEKGMQEVWSVATLDKYPIPADSMPAVLNLWRYSVNLGAPLTIRQAKWASRLFLLLKDQDISMLWLTCRRFAIEEQTSLSYKVSMFTDELQSPLVMKRWELGTISHTEYHPEFETILHTFEPTTDDGGIAEELFHAVEYLDYPGLFDQTDEFHRRRETAELIRKLPSSVNYFPDLECRMVYLRLLDHLTTMPKWNILNPHEILGIVEQLREWVMAVRQSIDNNTPITLQFPTKNVAIEPDLRVIPEPFHIYRLLDDSEGGDNE